MSSSIINEIKDMFQEEIAQFSAGTQSQSYTSMNDDDLIRDRKFEACVRNIIVENFKLSPIENSILSENKQFTIFKMELFEKKDKKLILSKYFHEKEEYYYLKKDQEYFCVKSNYLSTLLYGHYLKGTKKTSKYKGIEESQTLGKDSTKFFLEKDDDLEQKAQEVEETFIDRIKLNLISKETISFQGNNNNIPKEYLEDYRTKGFLLSTKNRPYAVCLGKEKEHNPGCGVIHYQTEKYYIKLRRINGQFDGSYKNKAQNIKLTDFHCDVIFSNFDEIPQGSNIVFEIKNGNCGENKIISQALKYQENAQFILKDQIFYHLIIVRSKKLSIALKDKIKEKTLKNFALLSMNDALKICDKKIEDLLKKACKSSSNLSITDNSSENMDGRKKNLKKVDKKLKKMQRRPKSDIEEKEENSQKSQKENLHKNYITEETFNKKMSIMMDMMTNMKEQIKSIQEQMKIMQIQLNEKISNLDKKVSNFEANSSKINENINNTGLKKIK